MHPKTNEQKIDKHNGHSELLSSNYPKQIKMCCDRCLIESQRAEKQTKEQVGQMISFPFFI